MTRASLLPSATPVTLLAQKKELFDGPGERDQIESLLARIDGALNFLDQHGPEQERRA